MNLTEKINNDIKLAMKAQDKGRLQALRAVKSAILLAMTESSNHELKEQDGIKLLQKLVKQRRDSADIYKQQGRTDLYDQEVLEAEVISEYLPAQMTEEHLKQAVAAIIQSTGASGPRDLGKVMGVASKELAGQAEGKQISDMVRKMLESLGS
jgi:uncharacterized protein YqeY